MNNNALEIFDKRTADWFSNALGSPTPVQEEAWPAIASGANTLVSAPTGTGKTLSAFLVFIDRLLAMSRAGTLKDELYLIYISPLKSLAGDIRENLRRPLIGIMEEERRSLSADITEEERSSLAAYNTGESSSLAAGITDVKGKSRIGTRKAYGLNIDIRTGDTPQKDRQRMIKHPPHILITTPESLFLLLTSVSGQKLLSTARTVIIDELHALIDSKRGAHLMLSIARLDRLCKRPLQRIGLSATIEPLDVAAEYLSPEPVKIVAPGMNKDIELLVTSPSYSTQGMHKEGVWQEIAFAVYQQCTGMRSVIAFVEGRAYAERLAFYVNQLGGEGFARTHHGSLSKERRLQVEADLRDGNLRLLCATSSMELGIDVGEIDLVLQIGCPRSISSTLQRLGRAGHNPGRTSVMHIFPRVASEALYCGLTAKVAADKSVELLNPPRLCLDVLAQHLVSMAVNGYDVDEVMEILSRAYPFKEVTREDVRDVLCMLAGDYEHEREIPVRPRIIYDRLKDHVEGDTYSRMLAVSAGGTIPDKGLFTVKTENGVKLGEVDEEFVFEAKVGDKFLLGSFAWQIDSIQKDSVVVSQSNAFGAQPPFYKGEIKGRRLQTGLAFGKLFTSLMQAYETERLQEELMSFGMDETSALVTRDFLERQIEATGILPDDRNIIVEHFRDHTGSHQIMVHSIFGRQINEPLAILAHLEAKNRTKTNVSYFNNDDGFLLFPYGDCELPEGLLYSIKPEDARRLLEAVLPSTALFNMTFRYNAARALMMGVKKAGRQPLWVQRIRSAQLLDSLMRHSDHPLIRETKRECLEDYWDLKGLEDILKKILTGAIRIHEMYLENPSPMSLPLRFQTEATMMYDYSPTPLGVHQAVGEALNKARMIEPSKEQLDIVSERKRLPEDKVQLHTLLMIEGDLIAGELNIPVDWLESLAEREQVYYIEPGLWIAAEHKEEYEAAFSEGDMSARQHIVRRLLRYRGVMMAEQVADRYLLRDEETLDILSELCKKEEVVESGGMYYHRDLYDWARRETIKSLRRQIMTVPSRRYAAILANRAYITAPPAEQLERALKQLAGQTYSPALWESILLPGRVKGYRPELLDTLLSQGNIYWSFTANEGLSFHMSDDIDWDADISDYSRDLNEDERIIYDGLYKRGACFMQRLSGLIDGSPYDILFSLAEKSLVHADSFMPVRQWLDKDRLDRGTPKQRAFARSKAMTTGRWELTRPLKQLTAEMLIERAFDKAIILSRETIQGISWAAALEKLRVMEYTGQVRRGYFIEGLSGIQFVRDKDFAGVIAALEEPVRDIIWLPAVDPAQQWGKSLPHMPDRAFTNAAGTVAALYGGEPAAVFERQGRELLVFDHAALPDALRTFVGDFNARRLYPSLNRLIVKEYPPKAAEALKAAGFVKEMQDYVLYRGIRQ